ncbi:lysosome-associated membrane glycoprotein 1-like [Anopheles moucheti]|uniref:lysosome-associated membrane glycoprotein 1-like n=1 Tax=Anopheles moucheti TaxID=186751 RepID=UPI0022F04042|nr:lysosome-associated membrane glycoprotein 1-like [Anopheles moucheti]
MHLLRNAATICLLLLGLAMCNAQSEPTDSIPSQTNTTTTAVPPTTTTTTTTTKTTTTTTTTTPKPTTTSTPATTTEPAPTTTTVAPSPKPVPEPDMGNWSYSDPAKNETCVIAQMAMQFNLSYFDANDKPVNVLYNLPKEAIVKSGQCQNFTDYIELSWAMDKQSNNYSSLRIDFTQNATEHEFAFTGLLLQLAVAGDSFPNAKPLQQLVLRNNQTLFKTPLQMSYHCNKAQQLNLTASPAGLAQPTVTVTKLQLEAFHRKNNNKFSIAKDCEAIDTPDIVPIAVGCALVTLIIIMLIAYLVGRNAASNSGYLSM